MKAGRIIKEYPCVRLKGTVHLFYREVQGTVFSSRLRFTLIHPPLRFFALYSTKASDDPYYLTFPTFCCECLHENVVSKNLVYPFSQHFWETHYKISFSSIFLIWCQQIIYKNIKNSLKHGKVKSEANMNKAKIFQCC